MHNQINWFVVITLVIFVATVSGQACVPSSTDCSFYSDCLEAAVPCGPNGYALGYGLKFCQKFKARSLLFSPRGRQWILSTTKCLQNALVPIASGEVVKTCSEIQDYAYDSHPDCYTQPGHSVCDLPITDWALILTIILDQLLNPATYQQAYQLIAFPVVHLVQLSLQNIQEALHFSLNLIARSIAYCIMSSQFNRFAFIASIVFVVHINGEKCVPSDDCSFYSDCLEAAVPCGTNGYAIAYGLKYCQKFEKNIARFSLPGREWVRSTAQCLQNALLPVVNGEKVLTCNEIRNYAFSSHSKCYTQPEHSICNMPFLDWIKVFVIISQELKDPATWKQIREDFHMENNHLAVAADKLQH
ncbi:hypothetical protein Bhyg_08632 [Pseudolycoriella hygida]|uniref:Uncharacterized protein n=1 Tax=Pseudolycoriella hygida TaxID=35572 RepID=A0A9Q0N4Z0_9DIPT|nr:hypothetical protein Bhyg_08632 [Pseudolycoriella hygida]